MNKQNNKSFNAVLISVVLHIILFGLLILGSFYQQLEIMGGGEGEGESISAVMVDTGSAAQEWGRIQQQKKGQVSQSKPIDPNDELIKQQEVERQRTLEKQKLLEQQKLEQKQREEQARQEALLKQKQEEAKAREAAEAAKLKAEAEAKRLAALAKQAEEEAKAKAEQLAKAQAEKEAQEKAKREAKAKAEKEAKEKEARAKAEKAKAEKAKAEKAKAEKEKADVAKRQAEQAALDDFLSGGDIGGGSATKSGNVNKSGSQGLGAANGSGDGGKTGDQYAGVIKKEIQRRFLKEPSFANKVCVVEVEFLRDGTITNYTRISGPDDICGAALSAVARTKKVPAAPTDDIYEKYKKSPIEFKLR